MVWYWSCSTPRTLSFWRAFLFGEAWTMSCRSEVWWESAALWPLQTEGMVRLAPRPVRVPWFNASTPPLTRTDTRGIHVSDERVSCKSELEQVATAISNRETVRASQVQPSSVVRPWFEFEGNLLVSPTPFDKRAAFRKGSRLQFDAIVPLQEPYAWSWTPVLGLIGVHCPTAHVISTLSVGVRRSCSTNLKRSLRFTALAFLAIARVDICQRNVLLTAVDLGPLLH